jgi:hypothetical protein
MLKKIFLSFGGEKYFLGGRWNALKKYFKPGVDFNVDVFPIIQTRSFKPAVTDFES